jgi:hypothetical protein
VTGEQEREWGDGYQQRRNSTQNHIGQLNNSSGTHHNPTVQVHNSPRPPVQVPITMYPIVQVPITPQHSGTPCTRSLEQITLQPKRDG